MYKFSQLPSRSGWVLYGFILFFIYHYTLVSTITQNGFFTSWVRNNATFTKTYLVTNLLNLLQEFWSAISSILIHNILNVLSRLVRVPVTHIITLSQELKYGGCYKCYLVELYTFLHLYRYECFVSCEHRCCKWIVLHKLLSSKLICLLKVVVFACNRTQTRNLLYPFSTHLSGSTKLLVAFEWEINLSGFK